MPARPSPRAGPPLAESESGAGKETKVLTLKKRKDMAFYKKAFSEQFGVYYPKSVTVGDPIPTKKVADRLARISTVSYADVLAVLAELPGVLADYMAQGKSVRLEGLGTFRYTLSTKGVADEADFDAQAQIEAVRVQFIPQREGATTRGGTQTRALVPGDIEWLPYDGPASDDGADDTPASGGTTTEPGGGDEGSFG